jgi:hypothetical protein
MDSFESLDMQDHSDDDSSEENDLGAIHYKDVFFSACHHSAHF